MSLGSRLRPGTRYARFGLPVALAVCLAVAALIALVLVSLNVKLIVDFATGAL